MGPQDAAAISLYMGFHNCASLANLVYYQHQIGQYAGRGGSIVRIIAGEARGRTLVAPKGMDTRPTLDRVRESLFNILRPYLADAVVLDLFAGSGALGLEAISRGAASAVFADHARAAQEAVAHNIDVVRAADRATILRCDWRMALRRLQAEGARFDLAFLDPPYHLPDAPEMLRVLRESGLLAQGALVVYEHGQDIALDMTGWDLADRRTYGDTVITFLKEQVEATGDADGAVSGQL